MIDSEPSDEKTAKVEQPRIGKRRSWLRYSLRTLLLLMLLTCLASGWFTMKRRRARAQLDAVGRILEMDGKVYYDYQQTVGAAGISRRHGLHPVGSSISSAPSLVVASFGSISLGLK